MFFPAEFLEHLRSHIILSELVGKSVKLERKGREFHGLCPFHNEKTPSFTVNDDKKFYHCFGCTAHGDVIKFALETKGLNFVDTITALANDAGIAIPKISAKETVLYDRIQQMHQMMQQASVFYQAQLQRLPHILKYLQNRRIDNNAITQFQIGFSPSEGQGLFNHLRSLNIDPQLMVDAGLIVLDENNKYFDRFRGRVMFPICNNQNKIIAFGGRAMGENQPKYLNSPETMLFKKSEVLYGENLARPHAYKAGRIIIVEGYIDVIAMHTAGFRETVASLGTAITQQHLTNLWQIANEPIFCLDGDMAGRKAMRKAAHLAFSLLKNGCSVNFAILPRGADPDETIARNGQSFIAGLIEHPIALSEYLWQVESATKLITPEQKAAFENKLLKLVETIGDNTIKSSYKNFFMQKIWQNIKRTVKTPLQKKKNDNIASLDIKTSLGFATDLLQRYEYNLTALIISNPALLHNEIIEEDYLRIDFKTEMLDRLRSAVLNIKFDHLLQQEQYNQELIQNLQALGFKNEIEYLCGKKSTFIDQIANHNALEDYHNIWLHTFKKYQISLLSIEYQDALKQMTEKSLDKALEIKKQIMILEECINEEYQLADD
jgi:DNA primase